MTEIKKHAKYSASGAKRWYYCAASISLNEKAPTPAEHPAAIEGTLTHECLELFNRSKHTRESINLAHKRLKVRGHPDDRIDRAYAAYQRIQSMRRSFPGATFYAETEVDTSYILGPKQFGTVDAAIAETFGTLTVVDYKNGVMPVEPENNLQGIIYALGIAKLEDFHHDKVDIIILQPNSRVAKRTESNWLVSMRELRSWEPKLRKAVARTMEPKPKVVEGEWCFFCPSKNFNCPAFRDKRMERNLKAVAAFDE